MGVTAVLFALLAASLAAAAFFAGVETGFLSVPRERLLPLAKNGAAGADMLSAALCDMSRTLTTLLVGNNLATVLFSTASASLGTRLFSDSPAAMSSWTLSTAVLMVFLGEYLPKLMFASRPLRRSLVAAGTYRAAETALSPLVAVFSAFVRAAFGVRDKGSGRLGVSRDGLRRLMADARGATRLTQFERLLIDRVLMLQTRTAGDLMHPRGTDAAAGALSGAGRPGKSGLFSLPADTRGDGILPLMRRNRSPVALVRDPVSGAELGVVSEEDVLLALTGILKEG